MIINYMIYILTLICIYSLIGLSLNLNTGYAGVLNLGQVALVGFGAYVFTLMLAFFPFTPSLLIAMIATSVLGYLLSALSGRFSKSYLALATLGFHLVVYTLFLNLKITNGSFGINLVPINPYILAIIVSAATIITYLIIFILTKQDLFRSVEATRDNEYLITTLGYNPHKIKRRIMALSGLISGLGGALIASQVGFIDPFSFGIGEIIVILTIVFLGGLASLPGTILGSIIVVIIPEILRSIEITSEYLAPLRMIIFAITLIVTLIYFPSGLLGKVDLND